MSSKRAAACEELREKGNVDWQEGKQSSGTGYGSQDEIKKEHV